MKNLLNSILLAACVLVIVLAWPTQKFPAASEVAKPALDLAIYGHVVQVGWVVKDLDRVVDYWEKLGLKNIDRRGVLEMQDVTYRGKPSPATVKMAIGYIGGVQIEWIQPLKGCGACDEFLRKHGDGIHHLAYAVPSAARLDEEIKSFHARGVGVVQQGSWQGNEGTGRFAYLNTAPQGGGLTIELLYNPDAPPSGASSGSPNDYPFSKIVQYAFVVHDVKKVGEFYQRLGFGGMSIDHNISVNRNYRGAPGKFEMYLGWQRFSDVSFEWVQELVGPSVYAEYLRAHAEGFHHLAFEVTDMDQAVELFKKKGVAVSQSGGWDSPGSKGRFAYLDTEPYGGVTIELLWDQPRER